MTMRVVKNLGQRVIGSIAAPSGTVRALKPAKSLFKLAKGPRERGKLGIMAAALGL